MRRRKFLIGAGSFAAATAGAIGTGAFSFVQADRNITVRTVNDSGALLKITPNGGPNGQYANEVNESGDSNVVELDFTQNDNVSGSGLNDQAFVNFENVLAVENLGTQEVNLSVGVPGGQSAVPTADFGVSGNPEDVKRHATTGTDPSGTADLGVGEKNSIGFFFNLDASDDIDSVLQDLEDAGIAICASTDKQFKRGIFPGQ